MSFNPDNPRRKALIAMSGGVDSSVAAYLAIESGLDCIGVTMKLFDNEDAGISREKSSAANMLSRVTMRESKKKTADSC